MLLFPTTHKIKSKCTELLPVNRSTLDKLEHLSHIPLVCTFYSGVAKKECILRITNKKYKLAFNSFALDYYEIG